LPRRVSLPAADDLFRPTAVPEEVSPQRSDSRGQEPSPEHTQGPGPEGTAAATEPEDDEAGDEQTTRPSTREPAATRRKEPSGRVRHDEKMTVYVTAEELLDLEHTRLRLRALGLSVDRGRLVREAVAIALADFEANGQDSLLARRLTGS